MSTNTFLKLGDIEGESTISGFEKQTDQFHQRVPSADLADPQQYRPHHGAGRPFDDERDQISRQFLTQYLQGPVERQGHGFRGAHLLPYGQRRCDQVP